MKTNTLLSIGSIAVSSIALNFISVEQAQAVNIVQNGGFVPTGLTQSAYLGNGNVTVPNWNFSSNGYNFLIPDGSAATTNISALNNQPYGSLSLYSSGQTVNSPSGSGWFIAADGAFQVGTISQTLTGLTVGQKYIVSFWEAAGQQQNFSGDTTDRWAVNLGGTFVGAGNTGSFIGGTTNYSTLINLPSQAGITPWIPQSMTFTAGASSQLLSFLAVGTPEGQPPFALLAGVSAAPLTVPEPFTIIGTLIGGTAAFRLRKKVEDSAK
jgi:hypothetical protein